MSRPRVNEKIKLFSASNSSINDSGFGSEYRKVIEKAKIREKKKIKTENPQEDAEIIILDDDDFAIVKNEPSTSHSNFNVRDVNGFLKAAKDGNLEEIKRYLEKSNTFPETNLNIFNSEIPIDVTDFYGWTATMCAAGEGNFEVCKLLLEHGADPGVRDSHSLGIVQIAQKNGKNYFVKRLFDYFCNG